MLSRSKTEIHKKEIESKFLTLSIEQQIRVLFKTLNDGKLPRPFLEEHTNKELINDN